jgi:hypothetical protein
MANAAAAIRVAIDLLQMPSRARMIREAPLPDGMSLLLRIAAMEPEAVAEAATLTGRPEHMVRQAAAFFVEQIMLAPDADRYRVLGANPQASSADLRRNMALLVRWLHPDTKGAGAGIAATDRASYVGRVTFAWDGVKTPERRAAYDLTRKDTTTRPLSKAFKKARRSPGPPGTGNWAGAGGPDAPKRPPQHVALVRPARAGLFRRALMLLFQRGRT